MTSGASHGETPPGSVDCSPVACLSPIVRSTDQNWNSWTAARVRLWTEKGAETHLARTDIARTTNTTDGYARTITTGRETLTAERSTSGTTKAWSCPSERHSPSRLAPPPAPR